MDPEGEGNTNAGRICGMIGTIMGVTGLCCALGVFFAMFSAGLAGALHH